MSVSIIGIGTWLPARIRTNDEWPEAFSSHAAGGDRTFNDIPPSDDPVAAEITARDLAREAGDPFLGAVRRRVSEDSLTSVESEIFAANAALEDAGISGSDVDLVLSYAALPDRAVTPPSACSVAHAVGAHRALALGVEAACATAIAQIELAVPFLESGRAKVVLLTQSHLLVRAFPMMHPASPGIGDCTTALVLTRSERGLAIRSTYGVTHGEHAPAVTWVRGRGPDEDTPWWKAGGDSRVGTLAPERTKLLMRDTVSLGARTVREAAARASLDVERISVLGAVQPRGFIPGAIAQHLGLPREAAVTTYQDVAHVGVCGPVYNLAEARRQGRLHEGAVVALYAQGAGFTRLGAILEMV
jgi:3-oxoacyl-[acyl-carrier-protein] synthase III